MAAVARLLTAGGLFHVATDWMDYAEHARAVIAGSGLFLPREAADLHGEPLAFRAPTKFEARGRRLGHDVVDLYYLKREQVARADAEPDR